MNKRYLQKKIQKILATLPNLTYKESNTYIKSYNEFNLF
jgi:hypothetical protein